MSMFRSDDSSSKVAECLLATDVDWIPRMCLDKPFHKTD